MAIGWWLISTYLDCVSHDAIVMIFSQCPWVINHVIMQYGGLRAFMHSISRVQFFSPLDISSSFFSFLQYRFYWEKLAFTINFLVCHFYFFIVRFAFNRTVNFLGFLRVIFQQLKPSNFPLFETSFWACSKLYFNDLNRQFSSPPFSYHNHIFSK